MNFCKSTLFLFAGFGAMAAHATGFGLYEASAKTYALGGAVVGKAVDAAANFHNPATLADFTNAVLTAGVMTEHPRARVKVNGGTGEKMDPGAFVLPSFHVVSPLPWGLAAGLGVMPEYGLGSAYHHGWTLANNSLDTTVISFTVNPNVAAQITDKWAVGAGVRLLFFDFEQHSRPVVGINPYTGRPLRFRNRLKGDNSMEDVGFQVGTKYDVTDDFSVGLVWKSQTAVHVRGTTRNTVVPSGNGALDAAMSSAARMSCGEAETELDLPQSAAAGFNWDVTKTVHVGGMASWTQWSSVDVLDFDLAGTHKPINLKWKDTGRFGVGAGWNAVEKWTVLGSYVFETDCSRNQDSTMLPAAHRHLLSCGLAWACTDSLELAMTYGVVLMDGLKTHATDATGHLASYEARKGVCHATGVALTCRF